MVKRLTLALLCCLPITAIATTIPSATMLYTLTAGKATGTITQKINTDADHYQFTEIAKAHFLFFGDAITEHSTGLLKNNSVIPSQYTNQSTHSDNYTITFKNDTATATYDNKTTHLTGTMPLQDNVSYLLQMEFDLANHIHPMTYQVVQKNKKNISSVLTYTYSTPKPEIIHTALGQLKTLMLTRKTDTGGTLNEWFAPKLHYALAKSQMIAANGHTAVLAIISSYKSQ